MVELLQLAEGLWDVAHCQPLLHSNFISQLPLMLSLHRGDGTLLSSSYQICRPYLHCPHLPFLPPAQSTLPCALISFPSRLSKTLSCHCRRPFSHLYNQLFHLTDIGHKYMPPHLYALDPHLRLSSLALFSKLDPDVQRAEWHCRIRPLRYLQPNTNRTKQSPTTPPNCDLYHWKLGFLLDLLPHPSTSGPPSPSVVVSCTSFTSLHRHWYLSSSYRLPPSSLLQCSTVLLFSVLFPTRQPESALQKAELIMPCLPQPPCFAYC